MRRLRRLTEPEDSTVYFIAFQVAATGALLVGHIALTVKNQFTRNRPRSL